MRADVRLAPILLALALLLAPLARGEAASAAPKADLQDVLGSIMSPACPGKLLLNCPSGEGAQLRELVRRKIAAGSTKEEIVKYFVDVYGIESLPTPPAEGFYLTAWLLPFAGLLGGFGVFCVLVRSWSRRRRESADAPEEAGGSPEGGAEKSLEARLRRELDEYEG
ncbi:MAG: cytochrome c-type biogenesis protein CcmH [bacterium]